MLGPILFLIYINDIKESSKLQFYLFADDISTSFCRENPEMIEKIYNNELTKVSNWLAANKLSLNVSKSIFVLYNSTRKKLMASVTLKINDGNIEEKPYTKYLNVSIDKKFDLAQNTMVPVLKKFPTSFSLSIKNFCCSLVFCESFQQLITFNEVSESVDGLQI